MLSGSSNYYKRFARDDMNSPETLKARLDSMPNSKAEALNSIAYSLARIANALERISVHICYEDLLDDDDL